MLGMCVVATECCTLFLDKPYGWHRLQAVRLARAWLLQASQQMIVGFCSRRVLLRMLHSRETCSSSRDASFASCSTADLWFVEPQGAGTSFTALSVFAVCSQ
jgi:hypothetical protein